MSTSAVTYCRICSALCGLVVEVDGGAVARVRGDPAHPLSRGYTCAKGRRIGELTAHPARLRRSVVRAGGTERAVDGVEAAAAAGAALRAVVDEHGPDAVALYWGTQGVLAALTKPFARAWWQALGSRSWFSTMTIDQAAKWVAPGRLGEWAGGRQRFDDSDVWCFIGTNPVLSMLGGVVTGFPVQDGSRRLRAARRRGMGVVVIDPRRSETAALADIHLQLRPGTDAVLLAGLLRVVLTEGLEDTAFCDRYVEGVPTLRAAVEPVTPAVAAARCGVAAEDVVAAARLFATGRRGGISTGTGADMGPHANLVEHLARCLEVVCGRVARAGDAYALPTVLAPPPAPTAEVAEPARPWERLPGSRVGPYGTLFGELPTATLPEEIRRPGPGRIRALVAVGGNPAAAIPGRDATTAAFEALDVLVALEPFPTETARLATHVLAPAMPLERADHTGGLEHHIAAPFAQVTRPVLDRPPGVLDDWELILRTAWGMGLTLDVLGRRLAPGDAVPSAGALLADLAAGGRVAVDDVARHPHGRLYDDLPHVLVQPGSGDGRFRLLAADVADELAAALADDERPERPFRLVVQRRRDVMNTLGRQLGGAAGQNPCLAHPADLAELRVAAGDEVVVTSDHGAVRAVARPDPTLRRGVVAVSHGFGALPADGDDPTRVDVNRLLSSSHDLQPINAMPRMTAVPVAVRAAGPAGDDARST